jgi:hypothetical protein
VIREGLRRQSLELINAKAIAYYDAGVRKLGNAESHVDWDEAAMDADDDKRMLNYCYRNLFDPDETIISDVKKVSDMIAEINATHLRNEWRWMPTSPEPVYPRDFSPLFRTTPSPDPPGDSDPRPPSCDPDAPPAAVAGPSRPRRASSTPIPDVLEVNLPRFPPAPSRPNTPLPGATPSDEALMFHLTDISDSD